METLPSGLYGITDSGLESNLIEEVQLMIECGATTVEYRDKQIDCLTFSKNAEQIMEVCAKSGVAFVINGDYPLALRLQSHLIFEDDPPVLGGAFFNLIGICASDYSHFKKNADRILAEFDFLSVCPLFDKFGKSYLFELVKELADDAALPVFASGGITLIMCFL